MPVGAVSVIAMICHRLSAKRPSTILDLGCGSGLWGGLIRNYLDDGVKPYDTRLIGVEGFEGYRNPLWDLYDAVNVCTIERFLEMGGKRYGAVLLLDVLEHFAKKDGEAVLERAFDKVSPGGDFFVGTPAIWMDQGAFWGNELERHRSLWSNEDLQLRGFHMLMDGQADQWGNRMLLAMRSKPC